MSTYSNNFEGLWSIAHDKLKSFSLENQRFALGVSGGADSIGLFHVFCSFLKQKKISELVVFHINFGLRGSESEGDEAFVRELCSLNSCSFTTHQACIQSPNRIQEQAREFRLEVQRNLIKNGYKIALAHNATDVAENVLMRISRGAAPENAAGMTYFKDSIFRPWLDVTRTQIRTAMTNQNLRWREDSSNEERKYTRNSIRLDILPILEELFPGATSKISQSFMGLSAQVESNSEVSNGKSLPLYSFTHAALTTIEKKIHSFLTAQYDGQSPVSRSVIEQISKSIHKLSTGLDGTKKEFMLPGRRTLTLTTKEISIN